MLFSFDEEKCIRELGVGDGQRTPGVAMWKVLCRPESCIVSDIRLGGVTPKYVQCYFNKVGEHKLSRNLLNKVKTAKTNKREKKP